MEPKIKVKLTVSDWDTYWDKLQASLAGGNAPDVFVMDGPLFPDYQTRDQLLDLTPLIARDGFDTSALADLGVKDFTAADGHIYGLPRDLSTIALYYNKTMFDAAGIPYPDGTWNWDKLVEVAQKLTTTTGGGHSVGLLHRDDGHGELLVVARLAGRRRHRRAGQEDASGRLRQGGRRHPVPAGPHLQVQGHGSAHSGRQRRPLRERSGGHGGQRLLARPDPHGRGHQLRGRAAARRAGRKATSVNPSGVVVYKGTKSPDAAWEFVKCYTGPQMQTIVANLKASMPANKQILANIYATSFDGGATFADALTYAHLKPSFRGYNEFTTALQDELDSKVFNDNSLTAKAALDEVAPKLEQLLGQ